MIHKKYYKTYLEERENQHPLAVLGEAFFTEQKKDEADLSSIRFAQGEVYYHNKDLEAAIYKWENVNSGLEAWAKKNIGDAYYELGWLGEAEKTYTAIKTESTVLSVEVALQLFSLYAEKKNSERVYEYIKKAISIDPDYPNVTDLARTFYEEREDWENAIELAVAEAERTSSIKWFDVLKDYVDNGYTKNFVPDYFLEPLRILYRVDQARFSQLTRSLWNSYKRRDAFLSWVNMGNLVFSEIEVLPQESWREVAILHHDSYLELMKGNYLVKELKPVIPELLSNWFKFTTEKTALFPAASVMAWSEFFPDTLDTNTLMESEKVLFNYEYASDSLDETLDLFQTVLTWAESNQLKMGEKIRWIVSKLSDLNEKHLIITGNVGSGKTAVINSILEEELLGNEPVTMFIKEDSEVRELTEISHEGINQVNDISALRENALVELRWPSLLLQKLDCSIISLPEYDHNLQESETFPYLNLTDGVLYVLDAQSTITEEEFQQLMQVKEYAPDLQINFLLHHKDSMTVEQDVLEEMRRKINELFPDARVLPYSSINYSSEQAEKLVDFINQSFPFQKKIQIQQQTTKLLYLIRTTLSELLEKRTTMENTFNENVIFNEDIISRIKGLVESLNDTQMEKKRMIIESYLAVKDETKREIKKTLPRLLSECSVYIKENSDFKKIHEELNEKMHETIEVYLQEQVIPQLGHELQVWLEDTEEELRETQRQLDQISETLNELYEDKKIKLECDFQVVSDWRRDINRMIHRIDIDKQNIMNGSNPALFLLKSAGKLFGNMQQNKSILYNQYKKHVKNDKYEDVTDSVLNDLFMEFDLFNKALKSDVTLIFQQPFNQLNENITEAEAESRMVREKLEKIKQNPEHFYEPLKIFEVRLQECEMIKKASEEHKYVI